MAAHNGMYHFFSDHGEAFGDILASPLRVDRYGSTVTEKSFSAKKIREANFFGVTDTVDRSRQKRIIFLRAR